MPHYQSANDTVIDAATLLLAQVAAARPADFTGTGVVFYESLGNLPHVQLSGGGFDAPSLDLLSGHLAETLTGLARQNSPWHDGFHFVAAAAFELTHIAQFVAPPIPANLSKARGKGARFMTALLSSLVPGIVCVGLVSHDGQAVLFVNGELIEVKGA